MFDELANELKTARENNSMSLAQVSNKSKIDLKFLEAMEQGDFAFLPDLYVRAFVKNFAKTVGLDEKKIQKKYDAARQGIPFVEEDPPKKELKIIPADLPKKEPVAEVQKDKPVSQIPKTELKKKDTLFTFDAVGANAPTQDTSTAAQKRSLVTLASLVGIILLLVLAYFLFFDKGEQIIVAEKPIEDVINQNQRYVEEDQTADNADVLLGTADSLLLAINASDTSWIKVQVDNSSSEDFILLPNSQKSIKAKTNYQITFGNSSAIKLQLNNNPLSFSGKKKSVLSVLIDKNGLKYLDNSTP